MFSLLPTPTPLLPTPTPLLLVVVALGVRAFVPWTGLRRTLLTVRQEDGARIELEGRTLLLERRRIKLCKVLVSTDLVVLGQVVAGVV